MIISDNANAVIVRTQVEWLLLFLCLPCILWNILIPDEFSKNNIDMQFHLMCLVFTTFIMVYIQTTVYSDITFPWPFLIITRFDWFGSIAGLKVNFYDHTSHGKFIIQKG